MNAQLKVESRAEQDERIRQAQANHAKAVRDTLRMQAKVADLLASGASMECVEVWTDEHGQHRHVSTVIA